ncbi:hypothetical protein QJS10_CPB20g01995 [Acorus calamus]|uniref:Pentatricopeptide repeat-containing protein n=1 Tax=Acorus calamus TaxID=4465 RepID=A0AAV9CBN6_ACOCL|nr:hypothetical protein QJS10_CPB20g01995 [Acorus calamus]
MREYDLELMAFLGFMVRSWIDGEECLRLMREYGLGFMGVLSRIQGWLCLRLKGDYVKDSWGSMIRDSWYVSESWSMSLIHGGRDMSPIHRGYVSDSLVDMSRIQKGVLGFMGGMSKIYVRI